MDNLFPASGTLTLGNSGASNTFAGAIKSTSGAISLVMSGNGMQVLSGSNTYTGGTLVQSGTLELAGQGRKRPDGHGERAGGHVAVEQPVAAANCTVAVNSDGGLTFDPQLGGQATVGGLSGGQNFSLNDSGGAPVWLTVGSNGTNTTYAGAMSGGGGLVMAGPGTLTLTGNNIYTGGTQVQFGTLELAQASAVQGFVDVYGGTLLLSHSAAAQACTVDVWSDGGLTFSAGIGAFTLGGLQGLNSFALNDVAGRRSRCPSGPSPTPATTSEANLTAR